MGITQSCMHWYVRKNPLIWVKPAEVGKGYLRCNSLKWVKATGVGKGNVR